MHSVYRPLIFISNVLRYYKPEVIVSCEKLPVEVMRYTEFNHTSTMYVLLGDVPHIGYETLSSRQCRANLAARIVS